MNFVKKVQALGFFLMAAIVIPSTTRADVEVFQLSAPISGGLQGAICDYGNPIGPGNYPEQDLNWTFNTISETIYLDTVNLTVQQVGSVSLQAPANPSGVLNETETISGHSVSGATTLSQGMVGGSFSFNTGPQPVTWNASSQSYVLNTAAGGNCSVGTVPVSGTYSLNTGGQTYNGTFNYTLAAGAEGSTPPNTYTSFAPVTDQTLMLSGLAGQNTYLSAGHDTFAQINAANGFTVSLGMGAGDYLDGFDWSSGPVTATLVPEPGTFALLGFGLATVLAAWALARRNHRPQAPL